MDKNQSLFDFLNAISSIAPDFAGVWRISIQKKQYSGKKIPDLYKIIELFRNDQRLTNAQKDHPSRSAFAASYQGKPLENTDEAKSDTKPKSDSRPKSCLCGTDSASAELITSSRIAPISLSLFAPRTGSRIQLFKNRSKRSSRKDHQGSNQ